MQRPGWLVRWFSSPLVEPLFRVESVRRDFSPIIGDPGNRIIRIQRISIVKCRIAAAINQNALKILEQTITLKMTLQHYVTHNIMTTVCEQYVNECNKINKCYV